MGAMVREQEEQPEKIKNPAQISSLLSRLFENHCLLDVRLNGVGGSFKSAVLSVDPKKKVLTLDELNPRAGHERVQPGCEMEIAGLLHGVDTRFTVTTKSMDIEDGVYYYTASFPKTLHYHQRREFHRVPVRMTLRGSMSLVTDTQPCKARLVDLSVGGMGGVVTGGDGLQRGAIYLCVIHLPHREPLRVSAEIRYVSEPPPGGRERFGAAFKELGGADRREIERMVAELQREQLRKT